MKDKCGFARAIGAQERYAFSLVQVKVDAIERLRAIGIAIAQAANLKDGFHYRRSAHSDTRIATEIAVTATRNAPSRIRKRAGAKAGNRPVKPRASIA